MDEESSDNLIAYRLQQVENGVKGLGEKFDRHLAIEAVVAKNTFEIELLKTTKNRLIASVSAISVVMSGALITFILGKL